MLHLWPIGKLKFRARVFYIALLRYCVHKWYCQGPRPCSQVLLCHYLHAVQTSNVFLHPQLQPEPRLAYSRAGVTTRLAALPAAPAYCSLPGGKGSSQRLLKSQSETARCLWPLPFAGEWGQLWRIQNAGIQNPFLQSLQIPYYLSKAHGLLP